MYPADMASVLWTIKRWGGLGFGLLNSGAEFPITKDGEESDANVDAPKSPPIWRFSRRMGYVDIVVIGFSMLGVVIGQLFSRGEPS